MLDGSGVVQQAGHAALDRRIGVRIPAPESPAVSVEGRLLDILAHPERRWVGEIDLAGAKGPIV